MAKRNAVQSYADIADVLDAGVILGYFQQHVATAVMNVVLFDNVVSGQEVSWHEGDIRVCIRLTGPNKRLFCEVSVTDKTHRSVKRTAIDTLQRSDYEQGLVETIANMVESAIGKIKKAKIERLTTLKHELES
jgi:hypothetical protein